LRAAKLLGKKILTPLAKDTTPAIAKFDNILAATATVNLPAGVKSSASTKLFLIRERVLRAIRYNSRRQAGRGSHRAAGVSVGRTLLRTPAESSKNNKQQVLRHVRSVRGVLAAERRFTA